MIARKSFLIIISNYIIQFFGFIGLIVLAKLWGDFAPEALGIIGFAMSLLAIFNIIASLGFNQAHAKRVSEGKDLGTCIGTFAAIKIFLTGLMVTVVFLAIFIWKHVLHEDFYDATTESMIFVFLFYYIFSNLSSIPITTFIATRETVKQQIPMIIGRAVKVLLVIIVAIAGVSMMAISPLIDWPQFLQPIQKLIDEHAVGSLAMTYVFDMMIVFFVGIWFLRKYPVKKPSWELFKSYYNFAIPIMVISIIGIVSINIDKIMIGYFWTSTEVGYYFTVQRVIEFISILSTAVATILFPTFSEYHSYKNFRKIKQITHLAERYISMVMIPPIIVVIVFVYPVINIILDSSFLPAASVLITLAIYTLISGLNMPYSSLLTGINRPGVGAKIGFIVCIVNIPLNYLFIPENGLLSSFEINGPTGAAIATVISISIGFIGLRIVAKKLTSIKIMQSHTIRHIIAGIVMAVSLYFLNFFIQLIRWYHLVVFAGFGLTIYLGILFLLREFTKEDLNFFFNIINPKEMYSYVKSELKEKKMK